MRLPLLFTLCLSLITLTACSPMTFTVGLRPSDEKIESSIVERDEGFWVRDRVAIVDISGLIHNVRTSGLLSSEPNPVGVLHETLEAARQDDNVKAIILRLNSPGGTVTASDAMYREIERFRRETDKPVVTIMMDVAASGGYYVACATDHVIAYPTTITASIGVIMQTVSVKPALARVGVQAEAITSGPNKDTGSPLSTLTDEKRAVLQNMVDDFYTQFVGVVREARPNITEADFADATDGRAVTGVAAYEMGLVDQLGDVHDAWAKAKQLAGVERAHLVMYHSNYQPANSPYARTPVGQPSSGTQVNIAQINLDDLFTAGDATMAFMYLWRPNLP
ncbi:MAG: signal peptide peptidase SppA [Phycisphaeraceae bacterium]